MITDFGESTNFSFFYCFDNNMYIFASRETSIDTEIRNTLLASESPEGVSREPDYYLGVVGENLGLSV